MGNEILAKIVLSVEPDEIKEMMKAGCNNEVKTTLEVLDEMVAVWRGCGSVDINTWNVISTRLNELWEVWREGTGKKE